MCFSIFRLLLLTLLLTGCLTSQGLRKENKRALQSGYKAMPSDMAVFGSGFQEYKYYTSKYYNHEYDYSYGKLILFASINRTDYDGYTVFETFEQYVNMTGFYYPYMNGAPCGNGGFLQKDDYIACGQEYPSVIQFQKEKVCFAVDSTNTLTKMNCNNPTQPDDGDWGDLGRRQLQFGAMMYVMKSEEEVLKQLLGYFGDLPVYSALGEDDGTKAESFDNNNNNNFILSKNSMYMYNDGYSYSVHKKLNINRKNVNDATNAQYPSYTEVIVVGYSEDSKVKINSNNYATKWHLELKEYTYTEIKGIINETEFKTIFKAVDNFVMVKIGQIAYIKDGDVVNDIYTHTIINYNEADSDINEILGIPNEYEGIGVVNGIYNEQNSQFILFHNTYRLELKRTANLTYYESVAVRRRDSSSYTRYDLTLTRDDISSGILFNTEYYLESVCGETYTETGFYSFNQLKECKNYEEKIGEYLSDVVVNNPICVKIRKSDNVLLIDNGCKFSNYEEIPSESIHIYPLSQIEEIKSTNLKSKTYNVYSLPSDIGLYSYSNDESDRGNTILYHSFTNDIYMSVDKRKERVYSTIQTTKMERKNYDYMSVFKMNEIDKNQSGLIFYDINGFTSCCKSASDLENNKFYNINDLNDKCVDCEDFLTSNFVLDEDICSTIPSQSSLSGKIVNCKDASEEIEDGYEIKTIYFIERENYKMINGKYPDAIPTYAVPKSSILYRKESSDDYERNYTLHDDYVETEVDIKLDSILGAVSFLIVHNSSKTDVLNNETNYMYTTYTVKDVNNEKSGVVIDETLKASITTFYGCPENITLGFITMKELEDVCSEGLGRLEDLLKEYSLTGKIYKIGLKEENGKIAYELNDNLLFDEDSVSYTISKDSSTDGGSKDDSTSNDSNYIMPCLMTLLLLLSILVL